MKPLKCKFFLKLKQALFFSLNGDSSNNCRSFGSKSLHIGARVSLVAILENRVVVEDEMQALRWSLGMAAL